MKKLLLLVLLATSFSVYSQLSNDAERLRINDERGALEAAFKRENSDCYQKYLVNNCLNEIQLKRSKALADLRRQEISLNDQDRKAKGAEQVRKTEDKESPDRQQQAADKRTDALRDFDDRAARDLQKSANRATAAANEKSKLEEAAIRASNAKDKQASRTAKQASAADEVKKYQQRLEKAQERQARIAKEKASQTKPAANPLPIPN